MDNITYINLYSWEYQSFHEGSDTYYSNFYKDHTYNEMIITSNFIKKCGFDELYKIYVSAMHDFDGDYLDYPDEWSKEAKIVNDWIYDNIDYIFDCMMSILLKNIKNYIE